MDGQRVIARGGLCRIIDLPDQGLRQLFKTFGLNRALSRKFCGDRYFIGVQRFVAYLVPSVHKEAGPRYHQPLE
jgi:hypothetical protein